MTTTTAPMPTDLVVATDNNPLRSLFATIEREVRSEVIKPDPQLEVLLLGLIARANVFLLGLPGIAKTMIAQRIMARIQATTFDTLIRRDSTSAEVLGPTDPSQMATVFGSDGSVIREGRLIRKVQGFLPSADFAILDEAFKGNAMILNALLRLVNEGTYQQDGQTIDAPLLWSVILSNELPTTKGADDLGAFYDRFPLRCVVEPDLTRDDLLSLLDLPPVGTPQPVLALHQVKAAQAEAAALPLTPDAKAAIVDISRAVTKSGVRISPRRLVASARVVRAKAWLDGASEADAGHAEVVEHFFWDHPDERAKLSALVVKTCSPQMGPVLKLSDEFADLRRKITAIVEADAARDRSEALPTDLGGQCIDVSVSCVRTGARAQELEPTATGRAKRTLETVMAETLAGFNTVSNVTMGTTGSDFTGLFWEKVADYRSKA